MLDESRFNASQKKVLAAEGNTLVSASAGSGKTTVMIEKILRLISEGRDIKRMAVMTFSRAAASEMKSRLVKGLYEIARSTPQPDAHIMKQLEAFPFANICTIDSFCYTLVKKYFALVGADPSAKPLDPDESSLILDECVDKACEERLEAEDRDFIMLAERYTVARRLDSVKTQIKSLRGFLKVQTDPKKFLSKDFTEERERYFLSHFKKRAKKVLCACLEAEPALREADLKQETDMTLDAVATLKAVCNAESAEEFFKICKNRDSLSACRKRKEIYINARDLFNAAVASYNEFLKSAKEFYSVYCDERGREINISDCRSLAAVTLRAEQLYAQRKKREGKLDFDDMGALALAILKDETVRNTVKESFDYIFVDEYQDTNYLQETLINAISNGNNVFVVGDVKQAIYHFRYAEPEIFHERMRRNDGLGEGSNILLNENYRSRKEILDFVNACLSEVMTEEFCAIDYRRENMMKAGSEFNDGEPAVEIYLGAEEKTENVCEGLYSVKEAQVTDGGDSEGRFVASMIEEIISTGQTVYRTKQKARTAVKYNDIAVLARKKSECVTIARALVEAKIPYSIADAEEGVYAPRELLVDFLRLCISAPDIALINALMSPVFNFTPEELMKIRNKSPKTMFWEALTRYKEQSDLEEKIVNAINYIKNLRKLGTALSAADVMTKVLSDGLDSYYLSMGGEAGAVIYKFLSAVGRMECAQNIRDFITYYDSAYKGEKPPSGRDCVVVMTMHKSKGLEFPVVILPFIDGRSVGVSLSKASMFADRELGLALKSADSEKGYSGDNFATKVQKLKQTAEEREELARLMYVAFTRAENRLILIGKNKKPCADIDSANCILDFVSYAAERNPALKGYFREYIPINSAVKREVSLPKSEEADLSYLDTLYPYFESTVAPRKASVSELLETQEGVVKVFAAEGDEKLSGKGTEHTLRNNDAAAIGSAYHLILQKIDLTVSSAEEIKRFAEFLTEERELETKQAEALDIGIILEALKSDIFKQALENVYYRELPFMSYKNVGNGDQTLIQGVIDLLIEEEDGLTVVDFKVSSAPPAILKKRYEKQLEMYAEAAGKIWAKPIKNRILFNILQNKAILI